MPQRHWMVSLLVEKIFSATTGTCSPFPPIDNIWAMMVVWKYDRKRGDYQNCFVLYCVLKLCKVISTLRSAVLTVLWIGFCLAGPISLYLDSFCLCLCFFVLSCHTAYMLYYCNTVGWTWWDWSLILRTFLKCFDTIGWVIWSVKTCPRYDP